MIIYINLTYVYLGLNDKKVVENVSKFFLRQCKVCTAVRSLVKILHRSEANQKLAIFQILSSQMFCVAVKE